MTEMPAALDLEHANLVETKPLPEMRTKAAPAATAHKITPVVLCGGSGARVWPESRETLPKQFIPLVGRRSAFQMAIESLGDPAFGAPVVVSHRDYRFLIAEQLAEIGVAATIVLEPERRGSAMAAAVAAEIAARAEPGAIVALLSSEHAIENPAQFAAMCNLAARAAADGQIVALGALRPETTNDGPCMTLGAPVDADGAIRRVAALLDTDRPDDEKSFAGEIAQSLGDYVFRCDILRGEFERLHPGVAAAARAALTQARADLGFLLLDGAAYADAPVLSLERAILAGSSRSAVLAADFGRAAIGSWSAISALAERDANGNSVCGDAVVMDASNVYVRSNDCLTAVVGVDNVVVVTTQDAVLVLDRRRDGEVRKLVERLRRDKRREAIEHRRTLRPWGHYQSVDVGARYQVKRIVVKPGARLSLQKHFHRSEHWIVVRGAAEVTRNDETLLIHENESIYLPIGCIHRLANPGRIDLELIEVQTGSYLGEDDIVRLEDIYNRG